MAENIAKSKAKNKKKTDAPDKKDTIEEKTNAATQAAVTMKKNPPAKNRTFASQKPQVKEKSAAKSISVTKEEKPARKTDSRDHKTFPLIPVALTAGTGICIARIRLKKHTDAN